MRVRARAKTHALIGLRDLEASVEQFGADHPFTALHIHYEDGTDPDDAFSSVPYEKGFNFLYYLQGVVGGAERFEPFIKEHVVRYQYGTTSIEDWKEFFLQYFSDLGADTLGQIDWEAWIEGVGMPPVANEFDTSQIDTARALADAWTDGTVADDSKSMEGWNCDQKVMFLERLLERQAGGVQFSAETLAAIDATYAFGSGRNTELRHRWATLGVRAGDAAAFPVAVALLESQGRMKFTRTLYRDMFKMEGSRGLALDTFARLRRTYQAICQRMLAKDLGVQDAAQ